MVKSRAVMNRLKNESSIACFPKDRQKLHACMHACMHVLLRHERLRLKKNPLSLARGNDDISLITPTISRSKVRHFDIAKAHLLDVDR